MTAIGSMPRHALVALVITCSSGARLEAQTPAEQGILMIRRGADTAVADRFTRTTDSLSGRVEIKGQGRIEYVTVLGPGESVRSLTIAAFAPGAAADASPSPATSTHTIDCARIRHIISVG